MSDVWQAAPMSVERWVSTRNPAVVWTVVVTDGAGVDIDPAAIEAAVAAYLAANPVAPSPLSDDPAEPLGVAAPGASDEVSRADHVHPLPTAADVGALPDDTVIPDVSGFVDTSDPRLSDARTPTAHTHEVGDITDFPTLATVATSGDYADLFGFPPATTSVAIPTVTGSNPGDTKALLVLSDTTPEWSGDDLDVTETWTAAGVRLTLLVGTGDTLDCSVDIDWLGVIVAAWGGAAGIAAGAFVTEVWEHDLTVPSVTSSGPGHAVILGRFLPVSTDPATTPVEDGVGLWCREIGEVPAGPVGDIDILWPESTFIPRVAAQVVAWS
jgi:hypothetical protein